MSGDDETFDIDLYGDEDQEEVATYDGTSEQSRLNGDRATAPSRGNGDAAAPNTESITSGQTTSTATLPSQQESSATLVQGTKRKAPDEFIEEENFVEADAQAAIKLSELQWWTTEDDLRLYCVTSNSESELVEVAFNEHKINGKSKGEAYMEFRTPRAASMTKRAIEKENETSKSKVNVWFSMPGNPYRVRDGQKKDAGSKFGGNQGAYNHFPSQNRGNYGGGRGRGNYNNAGRGGQWQHQNQHNQNSNNNQMMGGFGNMQFPAFNPMNMNQNFMSTMMGMGMNMQNMMAGRGGMMSNNRGGWNNAGATNNNAQQGNFSNNNNGWDGNKRARKE